jgi:hypothetical protein
VVGFRAAATREYNVRPGKIPHTRLPSAIFPRFGCLAPGSPGSRLAEDARGSGAVRKRIKARSGEVDLNLHGLAEDGHETADSGLDTTGAMVVAGA